MIFPWQSCVMKINKNKYSRKLYPVRRTGGVFVFPFVKERNGGTFLKEKADKGIFRCIFPERQADFKRR